MNGAKKIVNGVMKTKCLFCGSTWKSFSTRTATKLILSMTMQLMNFSVIGSADYHT